MRVELDTLVRAELPEPAATLAAVLDDWLHHHHGITPTGHHIGSLLDMLAAEGLVVVSHNRRALAGTGMRDPYDAFTPEIHGNSPESPVADPCIRSHQDAPETPPAANWAGA